jgi:hypothetical protein
LGPSTYTLVHVFLLHFPLVVNVEFTLVIFMEQTSVSPYVLVSTPRINTLLVGAPRLSDQSDRVFILGVETSIALIYLFQRHNILTRPLNALRGLLRHCSRSCFIAAPPLLAENVS